MGGVKRNGIHVILIYILLFGIETLNGRRCNLSPDSAMHPKKESNRFVIEILGNPDNYTPGEKYTVSLRSNPYLVETFRFKKFLLTVESDDSEVIENTIYGNSFNPSVGEFKLKDHAITKFSQRCKNSITQTNGILKNSIEVFWNAPPAGSGCVMFIAYVAESKEVWYAEDNGLTKVLCEYVQKDSEKQPRILKQCRACHEAKYELAFQGLWTRNTFPNKFPANEWKTGFSDLVGSSHSNNNAFWEYGHKASDGLKMFAETGISYLLDAELNKQSEEIRTFIRAKGLTYPNTTATTYATFRVDEKRHLMSVVSKIIPSPDWFVGVSNLELCTKEGSWVEQLTLSLYPWDAGTDDGLNYTWRSPSHEKNLIRRITSNSPNDERSPFYDPSGAKLQPLAILQVTRQNIYEKDCERNEDSIEYTDNTDNQNTADENVIEDTEIFADRTMPERKDRNENEDPRCTLTEWSKWSSCSASPCETGTRTRDRKFVNPEEFDYCAGIGFSPVLQENEECTYERPDCNGIILPNMIDDICKDSIWGEWSPCNVTCGTGYKERYRIPGTRFIEEITDDIKECVTTKEVVECYEEPCDEFDENYNERNSFGAIDVGNQNGPIIMQEPVGSVVDCEVSRWSEWSTCDVPEGCGNGHKRRHRTIKMHARNGGRACPELTDIKSCYVPCTDNDSTQATWGPGGSNNDIKIDCVMSKWSAWSPCTQECGIGAVQIRTRTIITPPNKNGKPCPPRLQTKNCDLPNACNSDFLNV